MQIITDNPLIVTNKGQLIILDSQDDLALFDKDNLVYWAIDPLALKSDLKRVPDRSEEELDLDDLSFSAEEAVRLAREENMSYKMIGKRIDADPDKIRKVVEKHEKDNR